MRANVYKIHAFCEDAEGNRIVGTDDGFSIVGASEVQVLKNASAYLKGRYPAAVQVHFNGGATLVAANVIVSPEGEGADAEGETGSAEGGQAIADEGGPVDPKASKTAVPSGIPQQQPQQAAPPDSGQTGGSAVDPSKATTLGGPGQGVAAAASSGRVTPPTPTTPIEPQGESNPPAH